MHQSITIVGRLGADPEMKFMPNGQQVTTFRVAVDRAFTNAGGERRKETTWFGVSVFGKQAEIANQYLAKGRLVLIEGRLSVDSSTGAPRVYQTKDGQHRATLEIAANTVRFLSSSDGGDEERPQARAMGNAAAGRQRAASAPQPRKKDNDDDIPF